MGLAHDLVKAGIFKAVEPYDGPSAQENEFIAWWGIDVSDASSVTYRTGADQGFSASLDSYNGDVDAFAADALENLELLIEDTLQQAKVLRRQALDMKKQVKDWRKTQK
jgi:hypothetical protein